MKVILFLAFYLPFEEFFLKWLPVSSNIYQLLRQVPDILILGTFILLLISKLGKRKTIALIGGKVDIALFLFISWSIITVLIGTSTDYFREFANIKALVRYIFIIYIILLSSPSVFNIKHLMKWMHIAIFLQVIIGFVQYFGGVPVRDFLAARKIEEGIGGLAKIFTGDRVEGVNDLMGSMGDNVSFAYYMLIGLILSLFSFKPFRFNYMIISVLLIFLIYYSNSRAVLIVAVIAWSFRSWEGIRKQNSVMISLLLISVLPIFFLILDTSNYQLVSDDKRSFSYIFNDDYIEAALNQRLGTVLLIVPAFVLDLNIIIGYGPDKYNLAEIMHSNFHQLPDVLLATIPNTLEDVYWVALLLYYGIIGLFLWCIMLLGIYKKLKYCNKIYRGNPNNRYSKISIYLFISVVFLGWFNASYETRILSFYLWTFVGISLLLLRNSKKTSYGV